MKRLFFVLAILILAAATVTAQALTFEQAQEYVAEFPDEAARDIMVLDAIERAIPSVTMPELVAVWTSDGVAITWAGPMTVAVAEVLLYDFHLPSAVVEKANKPPGVWPYIFSASIGLIIGAFTIIVFN